MFDRFRALYSLRELKSEAGGFAILDILQNERLPIILRREAAVVLMEMNFRYGILTVFSKQLIKK